MKTKNISTLILLIVCMQSLVAKQNPWSLWYLKPAEEWMLASPLGNGRLGAMVYGGTETETVALNEITMWSGEPDKFMERPLGREKLNEIRQLFFDGDLSKGNRIASEFMAGTPHSFGSHVPLGDLKIDFKYPEGEISNYKRELNIENAINTVSFNVGDIKYNREYFCSNPDDAIIIKLSSNKAKSLNFTLSLDLLRESDYTMSDNNIQFEGKVSFPRQGPGGVNFVGNVSISVNGGCKSDKNTLIVTNASSAVIVIDVKTDFKNKDYKKNCEATVRSAIAQKYENLKQRHIDDYTDLFKRVDLSFGESPSDQLPTDVRWRHVKDGKTDIGLDALFFHYARYLLIASSRENSPLPANLQGVWNDNLACNMGWTNDYHLDINTQQNYWLSNVGNLHESNVPLFNYIKNLSVDGQRTATDVYGARGWTANTIANIWGYTASGSGVNWGLFPTASSWIASHLWSQYEYTKNVDFLKGEAYPILKSNALFLLDYMIEHPTKGYLMTGPSTSPENSFRYAGEELSLSMMPACDRQLVYEIFSSCIQSSEILKTDIAFRDTLSKAISKLPPIMIGRNGTIQEWFDDFEEAQPNHRHTTHLLALYPFNQITLDKTPELAAAALKTIESRLAAKGWEDVEWSRANLICNYARLKNSQKAYESVVLLQRNFTRENLLTISPKGIAGAPYDIFIFDGNEAGGAGIAEMLVQSHEGYIDFIPALPQEWETGYFKGLCVRGGGIVDLSWKKSSVEKGLLKATVDNVFKIKLPNVRSTRFMLNGKPLKLEADANNIIEVKMKKNDVLSFSNKN